LALVAIFIVVARLLVETNLYQILVVKRVTILLFFNRKQTNISLKTVTEHVFVCALYFPQLLKHCLTLYG